MEQVLYWFSILTMLAIWIIINYTEHIEDEIIEKAEEEGLRAEDLIAFDPRMRRYDKALKVLGIMLAVAGSMFIFMYGARCIWEFIFKL